MPGRVRHALLLAGLALVGAGLAACGDDGTSGKAPAGPDTPRASAPAPGEAAAAPSTSTRKQSSGKSSSSGKSGASGKGGTGAKPEARKAEPSRAIDRETAKQMQQETVGEPTAPDKSAPGARSVCRLVSTSEAASILGKAVQTPVLAKQGPTCLYRTREGDLTTVSVQAAALRELTAHMRKRSDVAVGTRSGVCGTLGQPMLYLPVGGRKVLAVTGRCEVARRFASHALPRLTR